MTNPDPFRFFTLEEGNLFIRLLFAYILSEFVLQPRPAQLKVKALIHVFIVALTTFLLTYSWKITVLITIAHWVIDNLSEGARKRQYCSDYTVFILKQLLQILSIILIWSLELPRPSRVFDVIRLIFTDYNISLLLLGYSIIIWPISYLLKFSLHNLASKSAVSGSDSTESIENAGKLIGQIERVIMLTLVLLDQYSAIGFLITGKSIIRFADKNSQLRSEYVLVGSLLSATFCIITGVILKWLASIP